MRRLCLSLLCGLVVVPAAFAAAGATGDGVLELKAAAGTIVLTGTRGTVWGQMDSGKLVATDPVLGDGAIFVSGAAGVDQVADNVTVYTGKDLHFRVTGGKYKLRFKGTGIDLTAVGVGTAQLTGDAFSDPGDFSVDNQKWTPLPVFMTRLVKFGVQPVVPTP
jgi:hypothetical protein